MSQVVDYSFSKPGAAAIAAAGFLGAMRYLAPLPNAKVATAEEITELHARGLSVGFVWESTAIRARQGYSAGVSDAQAANGLADNLGVPGSVTIYYAVDFDAAPDDVRGYFQGLGSVVRRPVGGYGSYRVIEALLDEGLISKAWQTTAWSRGQRSPRAHLFQRVGYVLDGTSDANDVLQPDWGQWAPAGPQSASQEDDVKYTMVTPKESDHPHHDEVWLTDGLSATWVTNEESVNRNKFLGVGDIATIDGAWFDELSKLPTAASRAHGIADDYPGGAAGGQPHGSFEIHGTGGF